MQERRPASRSGERGLVMVAVVLFVLMLGGLSMGLLTEGMAEKVAVTHRKSSLLALQICEMGIVKAQSEIFSLTDPDNDGIGNVSGQFAGGTYVVTAVQHPTNPDRWVLTASGTYELSTRRVEVGVRRRTDKSFVEAIFSKDSIIFNGSTATDAYDSRLGTYAAQATNSDGGGNYAAGGGHVGSNRDISLNGTAVYVRGNAIPGPLYETVEAGGPTVWGDTLPRRQEIDLVDPALADFEAALANNDNARDFMGVLSGGGVALPGKTAPKYNPNTYTLTASGSDTTATLRGGTYFLHDARFTGGAQLRVEGPSVIYVTGDFDLSGGVLMNVSGVPSDLIIVAYPYPLPEGQPNTGSWIQFRGGSQAALALYAPASKVTVYGNDDVYGSLVGNQVTVAGEAHFHYDTALGDVVLYGRVYLERLYWRELSDRVRQ